jgi:hypothetical protein
MAAGVGPSLLVVSLPHRVGKAEALRRLRASFNDAS